jgi:hypothetical protein
MEHDNLADLWSLSLSSRFAAGSNQTPGQFVHDDAH